MLVLVRKNDEGFWIGGEIFVTVLKAQAGRVKLGVTAPAGVRVMRHELLSAELEPETGEVGSAP
jgi:carbon storage regulator CsrA